MEFLVSSVYGRADLFAFQRAVRVCGKNIYQTFFRWWGLLMGVWILYAGARALFSASAGDAETRLSVPTVLLLLAMMLLAVYLLAAGITNRSFLNEWKTWQNFAYKGQTITYRFGEKGFEERLGGGEISLDYSAVKRLYEDKDRFYLFVNVQNAHLIRKADFREGDPDAFRAFIERKTKLYIQRIK